jgi:FtsZ-binding cell division protein ZapB
VPQTIEQVKAESEIKLSKQENTLTHLKYENNELKDKINHVHAEIKEQDATQKEEIKTLKDQISDMYQYTHKSLDPLLDVIDELSKNT